MYEGAALIDTISGELCSLTRRIMVISPLPERIRSLLAALSADCFDVFSLHEFDKGILSSLQPELLIIDALPVVQNDTLDVLKATVEWLQAAEKYQVPKLVLIDYAINEAQQCFTLQDAELLQWPSQREEAIGLINRILDGQTMAAGVMEMDSVRTFKDIRIDEKKMTVEKSGHRIELTKLEYDLLLHFVSSDGSVMSRERLLEMVWGVQFFGGSNVVDAHIKSLRKKLKDRAAEPQYIATVRGAGYRLADH